MRALGRPRRPARIRPARWRAGLALWGLVLACSRPNDGAGHDGWVRRIWRRRLGLGPGHGPRLAGDARLLGRTRLGAVWLVRALGVDADESSHRAGESALDILKRRYAAGEITREEYQQMRQTLER